MNVGSGPTGQYIPETGVWIEERNRREAEDRVGGHPVSTVISPKFITQSLIHPKQKGRAQGFPDIKNKQA